MGGTPKYDPNSVYPRYIDISHPFCMPEGAPITSGSMVESLVANIESFLSGLEGDFDQLLELDYDMYALSIRAAPTCTTGVGGKICGYNIIVQVYPRSF
jgi:hypothetical protein